MKRLITSVALLGLVFGCGAQNKGGKAGDTAMLDALTDPARIAIERETAGGTLEAVAKAEFEGAPVYVADYVTADKKPGQVQVTYDGRTLEKRVAVETVPFVSIPEAVRRVALSYTGGAAPKEAGRELRGEQEIYILAVPVAKVPHVFDIDTRGTLLREEAQITTAQVPPTVAAALERRFPQFALTRAAEVREGAKLYYKITGTSAGRPVEATVQADGKYRSVGLR